MSTEVAKNDEAGALTITNDQTWWSQRQQDVLGHLGVYNASDADMAVFLQQCQRTGLDPWSKQIYMIGRKDKKNGGRIKQTIQTGIDGFRVIAERSNKYAGQTPVEWCGTDGVWHDVWVGGGIPIAARVGVYRSDFAAPLYAVAHFREYNAGNSMWENIPCHMIAKVAEALALRKAFPHDLSGLYTAEEMDQADARDQQPAKPQNQQPQPQEQPAVQGAPDPDPEPQPQQNQEDLKKKWENALEKAHGDRGMLEQLHARAASSFGEDHPFMQNVEAALREAQAASNEQQDDQSIDSQLGSQTSDGFLDKCDAALERLRGDKERLEQLLSWARNHDKLGEHHEFTERVQDARDTASEQQDQSPKGDSDQVDGFDWEGAIDDAERDNDTESLQIYVDTLEAQRGRGDRLYRIANAALNRLNTQQPAAA